MIGGTMTIAASGPRVHAQLAGPGNLGEAGVAELMLCNDGRTRDVYRLTVETDFHERAQADPSIVRLDPGGSSRVTVASSQPVVVRAYSEVSGQLAAEAYLGR